MMMMVVLVVMTDEDNGNEGAITTRNLENS